MAQLTPFCDLINLFSLISNNPEAENALWDEIWGCVNYIKIPYETVMHEMPVYVRKYWIKRHNDANNPDKQNNGNTKSIEGYALNSYAEIEQSNLKRK